MTTPRAILLGLTLVAAAMLVVGLSSALRAASPTANAIGTWQVSAAPGPIAWKLNTVTGELFYCTGGGSCSPARAN